MPSSKSQVTRSPSSIVTSARSPGVHGVPEVAVNLKHPEPSVTKTVAGSDAPATPAPATTAAVIRTATAAGSARRRVVLMLSSA